MAVDRRLRPLLLLLLVVVVVLGCVVERLLLSIARLEASFVVVDAEAVVGGSDSIVVGEVVESGVIC